MSNLRSRSSIYPLAKLPIALIRVNSRGLASFAASFAIRSVGSGTGNARRNAGQVLAGVYAFNEVKKLGPVAGAQEAGTILTTQLRKPGVTVTGHTQEHAGIPS